MGNQQTGSTQFCSTGQLYSRRSDMQTSKLDLNSRIGYDTSTKQRSTFQHFYKTHQQIAPQQQGQEEIVEITYHGIDKLKNMSNQGSRKKAYQEAENYTVDSKVANCSNEYFKVFEGFSGNIQINENGRVQYTDITGTKHYEKYNRDKIGKIFPMGISYGGLTKTIWFKDNVSRDDCFNLMTTLPPPSYETVIANPTKFRIVEEGEPEGGDLQVFEGINDRNVIVHSENIVLYTDINEVKHCQYYNKNQIKKCFPSGICFGGLTKVIWLKTAMERDHCFMRMQCGEKQGLDAVIEEAKSQEFTGLYGGVVLHGDSQIEFTTLSGSRVKCSYEPSGIRESFPKGISYGGLPKSIWFRDAREREKCINAMRSM